MNVYIAQAEASNSLPVEFKLLMYRPAAMDRHRLSECGIDGGAGAGHARRDQALESAVAAKLNDPQLEADLYPVGSWRDHPPTGVDVDLSKPHPEPPPSGDDDDENTEARHLRREHGLRPADTTLVVPNCRQNDGL